MVEQVQPPARVRSTRSADDGKVAAGELTRQRLMDAAEKLFATQGYANVSVRSVTDKAKQNLAAVNYHFGSKEGLLEAVYLRRGHDMNAERQRLMDEVTAAHPTGAIPLEEVLHALLAPAFSWAIDRKSGKAMFILFLFRSYHDSTPALKKLRLREAEILRGMMLPALRRALPGQSDEDLLWGIQFALGAMHYTIGDLDWVKSVSAGTCDTSDLESMIQRLVHFAAGGFHSVNQLRKPSRRLRAFG